MECANPRCDANDRLVEGGTLKLLEMEMPPERRLIRGECGFPVCQAPSRFFWLCERCSCWLRIARWTAQGLVLVRRMPEQEREPLSMKLPVREEAPAAVVHAKKREVVSAA